MTEEQKRDFKIINGNSLEVLDTLEENSIDAIVTDPPYELGFMGRKWDSTGIAYNIELWKKALRVLKCGGYLLAFGGTRTYHRIACAIEDAGFEIRDCIMWLYGSGFPKSMNIGLALDKKNGVKTKIIGYANATMPDFRDVGKKQKEISGVHKLTFGQIVNSERTQQPIYDVQNEWKGWGTCLKPSYEPIIVARKPVEKTILDNVVKYGVGGINIDECRVGDEHFEIKDNEYDNNENQRCFGNVKRTPKEYEGRFPANTILTYDESDFDEVCGAMPITKSVFNEDKPHETEIHRENADTLKYGYKERIDTSSYNDEGSASRYFYCAKASKKDRDNGLTIIEKKNIHPTVKPVELMQYLVRLVSPKGATILDIFNGSGSTGKAVAFENRERDANYKYIGIELEPEYCEISKSRIDYALNKYEYDIAEEIKENEEKGQMSLFDFSYE